MERKATKSFKYKGHAPDIISQECLWVTFPSAGAKIGLFMTPSGSRSCGSAY